MMNYLIYLVVGFCFGGSFCFAFFVFVWLCYVFLVFMIASHYIVAKDDFKL